MKNLWLLLFIPFLWAGDYVCHDNGTITGKKSGDSYKLGLATPNETEWLRPDCFKVSRSVYNSITRWKKVVNDTVVDMTQGEIDAVLQAQADAAVQVEIDRQLAFDDALDGSSVGDAVMVKVDAQIDAIASYSDLKAFLKKQARYLYKR